MKTYKSTVKVQAVKLTRENQKEIMELVNSIGYAFKPMQNSPIGIRLSHGALVRYGDYVVKRDGEFGCYPGKDFEESYEL